VTLLDTGDFYGVGHNELLLRDATRGRRRENAQISVKFGVLRDARGGGNGVDTRPAAIKNFLAYTLRRLGTDYIDIYRPARLDPAVPVEETMGALAGLVQQGSTANPGDPCRRHPDHRRRRQERRFYRPGSGHPVRPARSLAAAGAGPGRNRRA
jgi:predicted oxidoreductase